MHLQIVISKPTHNSSWIYSIEHQFFSGGQDVLLEFEISQVAGEHHLLYSDLEDALQGLETYVSTKRGGRWSPISGRVVLPTTFKPDVAFSISEAKHYLDGQGSLASNMSLANTMKKPEATNH